MRYQLEMNECQLRAGARVLRGLTSHDHPMVQRAIADSLGDGGRHEVLGCIARMEAALLSRPVSRWERFRAGLRSWVERHVVADYPGTDAL